MKTKYVYEITEEQKRFIESHSRMSNAGICRELKMGNDKVKAYREKLKQSA